MRQSIVRTERGRQARPLAGRDFDRGLALARRRRVTREQAIDMSQAHAEGWHSEPDGMRREGCPDCEDRPLTSYPPERAT